MKSPDKFKISMKDLWNIFFISLLFTLSWPLLGQEAKRMSLQEAINYAWSNSTQIENALISIEDAEAQIVEQRAFGLPQLSAGANYQRYLEIPQQPLPPEFQVPGGPTSVSFFNENNFSASLNLDALLFDGSFLSGLKAARLYEGYTEQDFLVQKREIRNRVIDVFLPVMLINKQLELIENDIQTIEDLLFETEQLYKEGFVEQLDIDRQRLSLENLKVDRQNLLNEKQTAIAQLKFVIDFPTDQALEIAETLDDISPYVDEELLTGAIVYNNRPELELADRGLKLNDVQIELNKRLYWPTLRLNGAYQQQYQGNDGESGFWAPNSFLGANLQVPIFNGLETKAKIERAELAREISLNQKNDLERQIDLEIRTARTRYESALATLQSQENNLKLAERIFNTAQIKYREGVGSSVERTQAEQSLYDTQRGYTQALYNLLRARFDLELAYGL